MNSISNLGLHCWYLREIDTSILFVCFQFLVSVEDTRGVWRGWDGGLYLLACGLRFVRMAKPTLITKKRKFVADGVFYSEINEVTSLTISWTTHGIAISFLISYLFIPLPSFRSPFSLDDVISILAPFTWACWGWICWCWSPCDPIAHWNHH